MMKHIGLWAFAGFSVAVCWAFIAATVGPHYDFNHSTLVAITIPISWFGRMNRIPMTYQESILLNSAIYALIGLAVDLLWRLRHNAHSKKVARP